MSFLLIFIIPGVFVILIMGRIAALDWGSKRIGFSVSDEEQMLAHQVAEEFLNDPGFEKKLARFLRDNPVEKLLIGLPKALSGKSGGSAVAARAFGENLGRKFGLPVEFIDERFSSRLAKVKLRPDKTSRGRKGDVDNTAAQLLLQEYLDGKH